jgi:3-dehydroquinate synthase
VQETIDAVIEQLISMEADRKTTLVGVGGGVITDITGYAASVYMRGIPFGFIPTSLLAMVDASIGGKNGIDVGVYKNMVGVIRQPKFILHDMVFLNSLPQTEWENGFAEIIKHACIKDAAMFRELEKSSFKTYQNRKKSICMLVQRNAVIKSKVVQLDEFEKGDRRLLNFGHTLGHALENQYELSHGQAVSIGMAYASVISQELLGFKEPNRVTRLLSQYDLPTFAEFDKQKVFNVLKMDKKRERESINYVLLEKIGKGVVKSIPLRQLEEIIMIL